MVVVLNRELVNLDLRAMRDAAELLARCGFL